MNQPYLFVTVGSTDFDPLVQAVDELMPQLDMAGIAQIGHGRYQPVNLPFFRFASPLDHYYEQASVVVAHGGLATTMEVLKRGLPLISVSNADRYDNHQDELLSTMADEGYLIWCRQLGHLKAAIVQAQTTVLKAYQSPACTIHQVVNDYLATDSLRVRR